MTHWGVYVRDWWKACSLHSFLQSRHGEMEMLFWADLNQWSWALISDSQMIGDLSSVIPGVLNRVQSLIWRSHSDSLEFFHITSLQHLKDQNFLTAAGMLTPHLKGLCFKSSGDLWTFMLYCLIQAHIPNSFNMFSFFIKQILSRPRDFLLTAALTLSYHPGVAWPLLTLHISLQNVSIDIFLMVELSLLLQKAAFLP